MDIDGRLNLLITDGSNKVYRWNQFWNIHGIDSIANEILIKNQVTNERKWVSAFSLEAASYLNSDNWWADLDSSRYEKNDTLADSLLKPHVFLDMDFWVNRETDQYYSSSRTMFSALTAARLDDPFFYAADSAQNRILRAAHVRDGAIKLGNGETYYIHRALFVDNVKEVGTGAGTVNSPTGLDVDNFGNLYYSQHGKQMYVHSVEPNVATSFPSRFELFIHDIMTPEQYALPYDVAVDADQMIYVANTARQEVLVFNGDGSLFKKAGIEKVTVDTSMWVQFQNEGSFMDTSIWVYSGLDSTLVDTSIFIAGTPDSAFVDTFYTVEKKGQLLEPISLAADERGVIYVCDPAQGGVFRFILSTSIDEELVNINQ
jgi:DNA-binding beta-propeller fold protein YncE